MTSGYFVTRGHDGELPPADTPIRPTLFIGLGGSGLKILARFRRKIYDRYGDADYWPIFAFLGIDTNKGDLDAGGVDRQQGYPIKEADRIWIGMRARQVDDLLHELGGKYNYINEWISQSVHNFSNTNFIEGASQERALGRLLFVKQIKTIREEIRRRIDRIGGTVDNTTDHDRSVDVVIIGSIAGGTGAGGFMDCAYLVRSLDGKVRLGDIRTMLIMPDVFWDVLPERQRVITYANGYAALRELEYFNGKAGRTFDPRDWGLDGQVMYNETPFHVCYLLSKGNGDVHENKPDGIYNLVADALHFSTGQTTLADRLRGSWSNAQRMYNGNLSYYHDARAFKEGGASDGMVAPSRTMVMFERSWSTRFSSLGISSITMKLRELRRIASVRLLRKILLAEIGTDAGKNELSENVTQRTKGLTSRQDYLETIPKKIKDQTDAIVAQTSGQKAGALWEELVEEINNISNQISNYKNTPADLDLTVGQRLVNNTLAKAKGDFSVIKQNELEKSWQCMERQSLFKGISKSLNKKSKIPEPFENEQCPALAQWKDLDSIDGIDLLGLKSAARKIIRGKMNEWISEQRKRLVQRPYVLLRNIYYEKISEASNTTVNLLQKKIEILTSWDDRLRQMQDILVEQFGEERNIVLTRNLAVPSRPEEDQEILDASIRTFLHYKEENETEQLLLVRNRILEDIGKVLKLGSPPPSLLEVFNEHDRQLGVIDKLVDTIARTILKDWPTNKDIFQYYRINGGNLIPDDVDRTRDRAKAYWPIDETYLDKKTHNLEQFVSTVVAPGPDALRERLIEDVEAKGSWNFIPTGAADQGVEEGELVCVTEGHGYALPSLRQIAEMKEAYDAVCRAGDLDGRHLDVRLIDKLPDLTSVNYQVAREEIDACDEAMLGILLGYFRWNSQRQSYQFSPDQNRFCYLGKTYQEVGNWLRGRETSQYRPKIKDWINKWFTARMRKVFDENPDNQDAEAKKQFDYLVCLHLALEFMRQHIFRAKEDGGIRRQPPAHTMMVRLQRNNIGDNLDQFCQTWPFLDKSKRIAELSQHLHEIVAFVGPDVPQDYDEEKHWDQRVLQLVHGSVRDNHSPQKVLDEAFGRISYGKKWFPTIRDPRRMKSLFPEQDEMYYIDGDIEPDYEFGSDIIPKESTDSHEVQDMPDSAEPKVSLDQELDEDDGSTLLDPMDDF